MQIKRNGLPLPSVNETKTTWRGVDSILQTALEHCKYRVYSANRHTFLRKIKNKVELKKFEMKVCTEDIKSIKPGRIQPFICDNGLALETAASLTTRLKRVGLPEGVVDYETQKFYELNLILIHAMKEGDEKVLNR